MRIKLLTFITGFLSIISVHAQVAEIATLNGKLPGNSGFSMIYLDTLSQAGSEDFAPVK
ncbi:MAG: hypothetical protein IPH84_13125 [Bacteroidales bacterium]|nr:hypothetical protein [Bacteroidales bacterium]